ncbi:DUF2637 domain-containing protein [Actinomadura scrupuli]|uniref:DUF2637 domain-containing protein n=1 Tax=Actinomadura scrupuli TaxID=559629 RepID=UPI003D95900A
MKAVAVIVAPMAVGLAALGGLGSFATVREAVRPYFGELAWIVPIGMDVGILILLAWDLLMEHLDLAWPVLRWVAWGYIAATVAVNVAAAHGDLAGSVMHAAMPVLFVVVVEGVRHLIRRSVGLASGTRRERIPMARWLLAPVSSGLLLRRMVLWNVLVYGRGLVLEYEHLLAVSRLQQTYGYWLWRWKAPLSERLALRLEPAGAALGHPDSRIRGGHDSVRERDEAGPAEEAWADDALLTAVRSILADADRRGEAVSNAALGRRVREQGFAIANGRIAELAAFARNDAARGRV